MSEDISQAPPPHPVAWRGDGRHDAPGHGGRQGVGSHARAANAYGRSAEDSLDVDDTVSVQGIPPGELTPAVRRAIVRLVAEVDRLRQELDARATGPPPAPHGFAPAEPAMPLVPEAFEDALRIRLDAFAAGGPAPAIAMLWLANADDLSARHGPAAERQARAAMTEAVAAVRAPDEVLGWTRGSGLAVLLPFEGQIDRLWGRVRALSHGAEVTVNSDDATLQTRVLLGVHVCWPGDDPADALAAAEQARRRVV